MKLISPRGTRVDVSDDKGKALLRQGWTRVPENPKPVAVEQEHKAARKPRNKE